MSKYWLDEAKKRIISAAKLCPHQGISTSGDQSEDQIAEIANKLSWKVTETLAPSDLHPEGGSATPSIVRCAEAAILLRSAVDLRREYAHRTTGERTANRHFTVGPVYRTLRNYLNTTTGLPNKHDVLDSANRWANEHYQNPRIPDHEKRFVDAIFKWNEDTKLRVSPDDDLPTHKLLDEIELYERRAKIR